MVKKETIMVYIVPIFFVLLVVALLPIGIPRIERIGPHCNCFCNEINKKPNTDTVLNNTLKFIDGEIIVGFNKEKIREHLE